MNVRFEGEAFPSEDERRRFGYEPNTMYVLSGSGDVEDNQRFRGSSVDEILGEMDEAYLGFEYVNEDVWLDRAEEEEGEDEDEDLPNPGDVPVYQREAVPASFRPGDERLEALREIEEINRSVADSSFSLVFYNEGRIRDIDRIGEKMSNTSLTAFPDIRGVQLVAYWPQNRQANLVQYSDEVRVPEEPMGDERGALIDTDGDFRTVRYPRDEQAIQKLLGRHEDWNITKNTLGSHEIPPEVYMDEIDQD